MSHSRIRRCEILLEFLALYLHGCDNDAMTSVVLSENAIDRDNTDFDEMPGIEMILILMKMRRFTA